MVPKLLSVLKHEVMQNSVDVASLFLQCKSFFAVIFWYIKNQNVHILLQKSSFLSLWSFGMLSFNYKILNKAY